MKSKGEKPMRPIEGTWFEFQHHNTAEGKYYNEAMHNFTAEQWAAKVEEFANLGMKYFVLMESALYDKAYFPTSIYPMDETLACKNPIENLLTAADKHGIKVFMSAGYYGNWVETHNNMISPEVTKRAFQAMGELYNQFSHHDSFYGWYLPDEEGVVEYYSEDFINYVNKYAAEAKRLGGNKKMLIAPYGTNHVNADAKFIKQLESLDVDFIAYQDEIGVQKSTVDQTPRYFETLKKLHDKAGRSQLWADIELFEFEGKVYHSALLPAKAERVQKQIEAVSPFVETILAYEALGMMNAPDTKAYAGHPDSTKLYTEYKKIL